MPATRKPRFNPQSGDMVLDNAGVPVKILRIWKWEGTPFATVLYLDGSDPDGSGSGITDRRVKTGLVTSDDYLTTHKEGGLQRLPEGFDLEQWRQEQREARQAHDDEWGY